MDILPDPSLLQSFLIVAEELNFRRSADRLNIDQSALSRRIQRLEARLGYRLLERTTRDVTLTAAGQEFCAGLAPVLEEYRASVDAARRIAQGRTGRVRVAYMAFAATGLLPRAVARFRQEHPGIDLDLRYLHSQGQKMALANDEVDVGYVIGPFDNPDYHGVVLASEALHAVVPRNHPLLEASRLSPRDLEGQELVLGDMAEWGEYRWRLEELFNRQGLPLRPSLEASNTLALIGLVAAGLGITVYPESLIGFLGHGVETRPIDHPDFRSRTVLVWKRTNRTRAVLDFVEIARTVKPGD